MAALLLLPGGAAVAQEEPPDEPPPPGSTRKVLELETRVLDLAFRTEDLGGRVEELRVRETDTEIRLELAADVLFDFDKADIKPAAHDTLNKAGEFIRASKGMVRIEGHTDAKGDDAYNQRLSEKRAKSVKDWFLGNGGLGEVEFLARGLGETKPVAPNAKADGSDDPDGRQRNRRVEIVVRKK